MSLQLKRFVQSKAGFWGWLASLFLLVTVGIYYPAISGGWFFDDYGSIVLNDGIKNLSVALNSLLLSRGIPLLSFAVDYSLWGLNPVPFRIVNVLIHLCNALLVVALCLELTDKQRKGLAVIVGLIFLCHPLQTSAVSYIVQRMSLMSALFALCSLVLLCRYLRAGQAAFIGRRGILLCSAVLAGMLSVASKENTVLLPCLVPFVAWLIGSGRMPKGWFAALAAFAIIPLFAVATHFFFLEENLALLDSRALLFQDTGAPLYVVIKDLDYLPFRYLLSQGEVFWTYLRLLALPIPQALDYCWPIPDLEFRLLPVLTASFLAGVWVFLFKKRTEYPLSFFGFHWILFFAAVESSVIPLDPIFEHRVYLLMAGLALIVTEQVTTRLQNRKTLFLITLVMLGSYLLLSWQRNAVWGGDEVAFWEANSAVVERAPRPQSWKGILYFRDKRFTDAAVAFGKLLAQGDNLAYLRATGEALYFSGRETQAFELFSRLEKISPGENSLNVFQAYNAAQNGQWSLMEDLLAQAQSKDYNDMRVFLLRALIAEKRKNDMDVAIYSQKVVNLWGDMDTIGETELSSLGYVAWAKVLRASSVSQLASWMSRESGAITKEPKNLNKIVDFAGQLLLLGEFEKAKGYYQMAALLAPNAWNIYYNLGIVSDKMKSFERAADYYKVAQKLSPDNQLVLENLAALALQRRKYKNSVALYKEITTKWPGNGKAWLGLCKAQELDQDFAGAKLSYMQAARLPRYSFKAQQGLKKLSERTDSTSLETDSL